ncbi:hypothetical protein HRbin22_00074 [Candidatus Thermoflexus japonica]|uniref:SHOCT domain-containing protein n=1 Tax=Candidatus Thermoflexus japonica TaxID=2035417 RepID=A0A2H5Y3B8_9CHLR|nr:hypothetical protein HRbin22_00074 [Candidatus Thermoflexus japonica]
MCCMMHRMEHSQPAEQRGSSHSSEEEALLNILKRRYAMGEITREQFEEMKRVLGLEEGASARPPADHGAHGGHGC